MYCVKRFDIGFDPTNSGTMQSGRFRRSRNTLGGVAAGRHTIPRANSRDLRRTIERLPVLCARHASSFAKPRLREQVTLARGAFASARDAVDGGAYRIPLLRCTVAATSEKNPSARRSMERNSLAVEPEPAKMRGRGFFFFRIS
jgi:hypothetical protein